MKKVLFEPLRDGYAKLKIEGSVVKETIYAHPEFIKYRKELDAVFAAWKQAVNKSLLGIKKESSPKKLVYQLAEDLLAQYENKPLIDRYDIYQHLMNYWNETMKDDVYMLIEEGWTAKVRRIIEKNNKGKEVDKGWTCDLLPKSIIIDNYFADKLATLQQLEATLESTHAEITGFEEEHAGEEGLLADATNDNGKLTKATVAKRLKEIKNDASEKEAAQLLQSIEKLFEQQAALGKQIKDHTAELDNLTLKQYDKLTEAEVKELVIEKKWMHSLSSSIQGEIDAISQRLTARIKELGERYDDTLGNVDASVKKLEEKVNAHLKKMGLVWS
jgi:type I restriction enzyme M protein